MWIQDRPAVFRRSKDRITCPEILIGGREPSVSELSRGAPLLLLSQRHTALGRSGDERAARPARVGEEVGRPRVSSALYIGIFTGRFFSIYIRLCLFIYLDHLN